MKQIPEERDTQLVDGSSKDKAGQLIQLILEDCNNHINTHSCSLFGSAYIGRGPHNDISLDFDSYVSRKHCKIEKRGNCFYVLDLNSLNHTYYYGTKDFTDPNNRVRITSEVAISDGDVIQIGKSMYQIRFIDENGIEVSQEGECYDRDHNVYEPTLPVRSDRIDINYVRELFKKKEALLSSLSPIEIEKVRLLKGLLKYDDLFFRIKINLAIDILLFLGVSENQVAKVYMSLMSAENYVDNDYYLVGNDIDNYFAYLQSQTPEMQANYNDSKIRKTEEEQAFGGYKKYYDGCNGEVIEIICEIESNGVEVKRVKISEDVERDMKTVDGLVLSSEEFKDQYPSILVHGRELFYGIEAVFKGIEFELFKTQASEKLTLYSINPGLELTDFYTGNQSRN